MGHSLNKIVTMGFCRLRSFWTTSQGCALNPVSIFIIAEEININLWFQKLKWRINWKKFDSNTALAKQFNGSSAFNTDLKIVSLCKVQTWFQYDDHVICCSKMLFFYYNTVTFGVYFHLHYCIARLHGCINTTNDLTYIKSPSSICKYSLVFDNLKKALHQINSMSSHSFVNVANHTCSTRKNIC